MIYQNLIGKKKYIFILVGLLIIIYPIIALLLQSLGGSSSAFSFIENERIFNLFIKTLVWAFVVSLIATFIATISASFLWMKGRSNSLIAFTFLLLGFLIPPFVHSATWNQILINLFGFSYKAISSMEVAGWVQLSCYVAFATGIILIALSKIDKQTIAVAKMYRTDSVIFRKVILPSIKPIILVVFGLIFLLSFSDYTVPSLFAQSVYSLEIMAEFNSSYSVSRAMSLSYPLLIVQIIIFIIMLTQVKEGLYQKTRSYNYNVEINLPLIMRIIFCVGFLVVVLSIILPIIILLFNQETLSILPQALYASKDELLSSLKINLFSSILIMVFILPFSMSILALKNRKLLLILFILPLIVPASLIGIALINGFLGVLPKEIYSSILMPSIAVWQKSLPFVLLVNLVSLEFLSDKYLEPALIFTNKKKIFTKILIPLYLPTIIASFVITFVMGFNELSATLLVVPPGQSTLAIKIYNYLHYGASDYVNALCLFVLLIAVFSSIILGLLYKKGRLALD